MMESYPHPLQQSIPLSHPTCLCVGNDVSFPDAQWLPAPSPLGDHAVGIGAGALQLGYQSHHLFGEVPIPT